jgi:Leishmanolysin/EGF-like domain
MILAFITLAFSYACIDSDPWPLHISRRTQTGPPVPGPNWQGIRIYPVYINTSDSSGIISDYMPLAIAWYHKVLKVVQTPTITLQATECAGIRVPTAYQNASVEADLVILVTYASDNVSAAWAQPCELDEDIGMRPVMGRVHFQGPFTGYTWEQMFSQAVHQIAHVLAYDARLLPYFQGQVGEYYGLSQVLGYTTRRNNQISYIKSPLVVEASRKAFRCNNLYGLDLETTFSEQSTSLHWEKRVMNNDFMVGDSRIYYVTYSDISFSLFEDSGWYLPDYSYSDTITWGYNEGCDFLLNPCLINGDYISGEFCNISSTISACDHTHTYKGYCNLGTQSTPIPTQYQYFGSPYTGGSDTMADYCPYVYPSDYGSCQGIGADTTAVDANDYGEMVCESCKCLEGTYVSQLSALAVHYHSGCHQVTCEGDVAIVHVGDEIVFCDPGGGQTIVRGYNGYINCPSSNILCKNLPCPFACHGRGKCTGGVCSCDAGYYGNYCESFSRVLECLSIIILLNL